VVGRVYDGPVRRLAALVLLPVLAAAATAGTAATAGATTVVLRNTSRPSVVAEMLQLGPCDHAITADEAAGTTPTPCVWPPPGGNWDPPVTTVAGDTLEVALGAAPAAPPQAALVTFGAQRRLVLGPGDLTPTSDDGRLWQIALPDPLPDLALGLGVALVVDGQALMGLLVPPADFARAPLPPPLAFRSATLNRARRTIDVRLQSIADVAVSVVLTRNGTRIGRRGVSVHPGRTLLPVRIGPRTARRLRPGLHLDLRIYYGAPDPVVVLGAPLRTA
jgi:hypothetical protein